MKSLFYDNIYLVPRYSELNSRAQADTSVNFLGKSFKLPIIPSNMESVIDEKLAHWFSENDYFYIMHRFNVHVYNFLWNSQNWKTISISCGVNENTTEFEMLTLAARAKLRIDYITIDVAHGHHKKVKERIQWLKEVFPKTKVIAGNVATPEATEALLEWGADAIKAGIGTGSICTTKMQTGFSFPIFSCIQNCANGSYLAYNDKNIPYKKQYKKGPIIADGGVKHIGDIAKAIRAGATMVMCGGLFASCIDSPAKIKDGKKIYYGSTSFEAKKENHHIEGKSIEIPFDVTVADRMEEIRMALQSSISYAGGNKLQDLTKVDYIVI